MRSRGACSALLARRSRPRARSHPATRADAAGTHVRLPHAPPLLPQCSQGRWRSSSSSGSLARRPGRGGGQGAHVSVPDHRRVRLGALQRLRRPGAPPAGAAQLSWQGLLNAGNKQCCPLPAICLCGRRGLNDALLPSSSRCRAGWGSRTLPSWPPMLRACSSRAIWATGSTCACS